MAGVGETSHAAFTEPNQPISSLEIPEPAAEPLEKRAATPGGASRFSLGPWLASLRARFPARSAPAATTPAEQDGAPEQTTEKAEAADAPVVAASDFNPARPESPAPAESSDAIFVDIGQQLRARREMLSLTYDEIERHTHVRAQFQAALEQGCLEDLPSPVQTRGILVNYATFLDLDVDAILLRFADGVQARYREKGPRTPVRSRAPLVVKTKLPPLRGFIASDLVFGGGLAVTLLLFAVWGINRVMVMRAREPVHVTPPSISDVLVATAIPTLAQEVTLIPAQATPVVATSVAQADALEATGTLELATLDPTVKVQLVLTATQSTYMRITVDGKVKFEGRAETGTSYSYEAANQVEVLTGNAAALRVTYNTQDLGLMGNFGEVVDRLYTAEGIATPTATPQPTRTPTPRVTATPTQTLTLTPSPTEAP